MLHGVNHVGARFVRADPPGARDVDADAIAAHQVGVEGDDLIGLGDPAAAFLKPGIGPGARAEQAGLNPFAAAFDVFSVEYRPDVIF